MRVGLSRDEGGAFGTWSSLGWHALSGKNVQDNQRLQLMAGLIGRVINREDQLLPNLIVGSRAEVERSPDYAPNRFLFYFRYAVDRNVLRPVSFPPEPVTSSSQY